MSYGGSSLVLNMAIVGILLNISADRVTRPGGGRRADKTQRTGE